MTEANTSPNRRASMIALAGLVAGCGGGGGASSPATPMSGTVQYRDIAARSNVTTYPLHLYLPPGIDAIRATVPTVYLLDAESRFQTLVDIVELTRTRVIIVGIGNEALRARDYVPSNLCTPGGGGEAAFLEFIRSELIPFIATNFGGDPLRRALLGHSHGGSFVLYALFAQAALFSAYLASDASIGCMESSVYGWEAAYAASHTLLPVRLHVSYASNLANVAFVERLLSRRYGGLNLSHQFYLGGHIGMILAAFADALAFALSGS